MEELKIDGFESENNQSGIAAHREETNTLRLDKLYNRVTIILIIIPIIIAAILIFAYLDMQETVIDVNKEKQNKIVEITSQFGEKANAFDVKLAKIDSILEKTLPEIEKKIKKLEASLAKLSTRKADKKKIGKEIAKLNSANSKYKTKVSQIEKAVKGNQTLLTESNSKVETDISIINEALNTKFAQMDDYENSVAITLKNLSILEKKYAEFSKNAVTNKTLVTKIDRVNQTLNTKLDKLEKKIETSSKNTQSKPAIPKTTSSNKPIVEELLEE